MKYCKQCLQPDTRPNTIFSNSGLCPACVYSNEIQNIDWQERYNLLADLTKPFKNDKKNSFDCIVGVSGGKDSTRQALWVRDKLGLNPLLVCALYHPQQMTRVGAENIANLIELGFDVVVAGAAPGTYKELIKQSFFKFTDWSRSAELVLFSSVPQIAIKYDIKLIFWGENPALQIGDSKALGKTGFDGNNLRNLNTLTSGFNWILDLGYNKNEVLPYLYPTPTEFENSNIQIIYLGWFLGDWSLVNNGAYACSYGFKPREEGPEMTSDLTYVSAVDEDWHNMNQMVKYFKFGFGRTTGFVNEQIRSKKLTRDQAIKLVEKYDGVCSEEYIDSFCAFIGIKNKEFWDHIHSNINRTLFDIDPITHKTTRKFTVGVDL